MLIPFQDMLNRYYNPAKAQGFAKVLLALLLSIAFSAQGIAQPDTAQTDIQNASAPTVAVDSNTVASGGTADVPAQEGGIPSSAEAIAAGESLFENNCTQCHAINEVVVGPALGGVHERRPVEWLIKFIKNSQQVIQSGDQYAVNLYNQYNKTQMPAFNFKDDQILSIVAYIKDQTGKAPATAVAGGGGDGQVVQVSQDLPGYVYAIFAILGVVLLLVLAVLFLVIAVLRKHLGQKEGLSAADKEMIDGGVSFRQMVTSRPFLFLVIFLFTAVVFKNVIDGLYSIGVAQGYMPTQPIAYSHKLHAGTYQIDCNYCHTSVYKGKSANIPSANICMNCHNTIKTDSEEIAKIYDAIGWDKENKEYIEGYEQKPIEWKRIHNLPDLVYFNHSQHTNVGGIECQTCHGPIQEMEVVYQYSSLTMGWCINCHRETEVKTANNGYYDKLVELHEASKAVGNMKVEDIGGLECARCHY